MVRVSNTIVGILNSISLLLGLVAIAASIFFYVHDTTQCQKIFQLPLLIVGAFIIVVSLLGLIGSCWRVNSVLVTYLILMVLLIFGLIGFTVFAIVVTNDSVSKVVSGGKWLQNNLVSGKNWDQIKNCLIDAPVCKSLGNEVDKKTSEFYLKNLSPIQSGCCQPPSICGFESKNATFWVAPVKGPAVQDSDCKTWSNQQQTLCFDCNLCKAGVLANIKNEWRHLAMFNAIALVVIIFVYCVGCCARKNNKEDTGFDNNYIYKGYGA